VTKPARTRLDGAAEELVSCYYDCEPHEQCSTSTSGDLTGHATCCAMSGPCRARKTRACARWACWAQASIARSQPRFGLGTPWCCRATRYGRRSE